VEAVADSANPSEPLTLGETLAREREQQGQSRADVAQRLHMSAWQVEALEAGDYSRLPKGTFLRGFVRNYAKVLGLPADAVLSLLKEGRPHDPAPGIVVPTQNIRFDPIGERLASPYVKAAVYAVVAVSVAFAGMYWWLFVKPASPSASTAKKAVQQQVVPHNVASAPLPAPMEPAPPRDLTIVPPAAPAEAPRAESTKTEPAKSEPARPEPAKAAPAKAAPAKAEPAKAEAAKAEPTKVAALPTGAERRLRFVFKGESWVEVRDARGRVLLQQLNPAGGEATLTAKPPLAVIIGNAPDVQLTMNDRNFDLEPHTRVAVARFTIE
jgi:cytoskeleton protein RodZ